MLSSWTFLALGGSLLVPFAAFSASPTYKLNSYSVGPGATNGAASSTYRTQATVGEQANGSTNSPNDTAKNGAVQTEQLNLPLAPTLSNGGGTYSNKLNCTLNTSNLPSDATYAVAVSTSSGFGSYNYVQSNGTLGASAVYQTYTLWGGSSGSAIIGLAPNTTYYVAVTAQQGLFTNTELGAQASASTVGPTLTFSLSPNSSNIGTMLPGTIATSSNMTFSFATNGASGGNIYVAGTNNGFKSASKSYTIPAFSGNLSGQTQGFGIQATSPTQTSGGPFTAASPFNGSGHTVGAESSTFLPILTSSAAITGGSANANVQALANNTAPPSNDYNEVFTFIAAANF